MAKFKVDDIVINENGILAKIHEIVIYTNEYVVEYLNSSSPNFSGRFLYDTEGFDKHWDIAPTQLPLGNFSNAVKPSIANIAMDLAIKEHLKEKSSLSERKCTCGINITYGKNADLSFHSHYCDLIKKLS